MDSLTGYSPVRFLLWFTFRTRFRPEWVLEQGIIYDLPVLEQVSTRIFLEKVYTHFERRYTQRLRHTLQSIPFLKVWRESIFSLCFEEHVFECNFDLLSMLCRFSKIIFVPECAEPNVGLNLSPLCGKSFSIHHFSISDSWFTNLYNGRSTFVH